MSNRNRPESKAVRRAKRAFNDTLAASAAGDPAVVTPLVHAFGGVAPAGSPGGTEPGPATAVVIERFAALTRAGVLDRCAHLRPGVTGHWAAWEPGRVMCVACCAPVARRAAADAAAACDSCGRKPAPGEPLRAVVAACEGALVYARLCAACRGADEAAAAVAEEDV